MEVFSWTNADVIEKLQQLKNNVVRMGDAVYYFKQQYNCKCAIRTIYKHMAKQVTVDYYHAKEDVLPLNTKFGNQMLAVKRKANYRVYRKQKEGRYGCFSSGSVAGSSGSDNHLRVRKDLMDYLQASREDKFASAFGSPGEVLRYVAKHRMPKEWGTMLELILAARLYGINIVLYSPEMKSPFAFYSADFEAVDTRLRPEMQTVMIRHTKSPSAHFDVALE